MTTSTMTDSELILWNKIRDLAFDGPDSSFTFSTRLARENGWTVAFAERVILEYRKFIFLCAISDTGITPSDAVDQAWHLHLTYTKSYWTDLCRNTLGKEVHHNPTKGGDSEAKKFDGFYTGTRSVYLEKFGEEPPADIWPDNSIRFSDTDFQRVNLRTHKVVKAGSVNRTVMWVLIAAVSVVAIKFPTADLPLFPIMAVCGLLGFFIYRYAKYGNTEVEYDRRSSGGCNGGGGCTSWNSSDDSGSHHGSHGGYSGDSHGCSSGCSGCSSGCSGCGGGD